MDVWKMTITEWITLGYLGLLSVEDIRKKELPVSLLAVGGGMALIRELFMLVTKQWSIQDAVIGAIPGLLLLGMALVQGGVGAGDGLVLLILGGLLERKICVGGFLWGSFGAAVAAGLFWWFGKKGGHWRFPFLPFLTAGVILEKLLEGVL